MQPKVKITLSVLTFVAMVLTGLAAAEQMPRTPPTGKESLLSPSIISLSPKVVGSKGTKEEAIPQNTRPLPVDTFIKDFPTMVE